MARNAAATVLDVVADLDASTDAVRAEGLAAREGVAAACLHLHRLVEKKKEALLAQVGRVIYIYIYIHTYIHAYIHTYIHTDVRIYIRRRRPSSRRSAV